MIHPSTFSIAAYDPQENAWGVAVASKFLAVGSLVPWASAGMGAVATQSYANTSYGPQALSLMASGFSAQEALDHLIAADEGRQLRQVGLVDAKGGSAAFTGESCYEWAGHICGPCFTCQGNILVSADTLKAMAEKFTHAKGELADRLVAALAAGDAAGGDSRGRQSAAILVVKAGAGYGGFNDRYLDLRVDDHPDPVSQLTMLVNDHHIFFSHSRLEDRLPIEGGLVNEIQAILVNNGVLSGHHIGVYDEATRRAFESFIGRENLEERIDPHAGFIDPPALDYLRRRFGG